MRRDPSDALRLQASAGLPAAPAQVIAALTPLLGEERLARIDAVLARRTRDVAIVLEAVDDPRNVSAVLRSADAFGVQEVHLVRGEQAFVASKLVAQGADRWLDLVEHADAPSAVASLRRRGFTVYVATMDGEIEPPALHEPTKVAIVFGNEHRGASTAIASACDGRYTIPMRGFSQSLNVSVAAAITLHAAIQGRAPSLEPADREALCARFMLSSVERGDEIVAEHLRRR